MGDARWLDGRHLSRARAPRGGARHRSAAAGGCLPVELVSGPPSTDAGSSSLVDTTADGRYVLFNSTSSDLVPGDTNGATEPSCATTPRG